MPFLSVLGYDVHDPTEFVPEHVADFAKRRAGGPAEKVDYAIHRDGVPVLFIECKSVDSDPSRHSGQLNQKKKSIVTKVPQSQAVLLAPGFEVEVFQEYSRVYIGAPKDIHRLRSRMPNRSMVGGGSPYTMVAAHVGAC